MRYKEIDTPDWLLDAVPGAREAAEAYVAACELVPALSAAVAAAIQANRPLGKVYGTIGNTRLGPAHGVSTADFEAGQARLTEANRALEANARKVRAALATYRALLWEYPVEKRAPLAASVAVARHERAVALWEELARTIAERDKAWGAAGRPGRAWHTHKEAPLGGASYVLGRIATVMEAVVGGFDVDALRRVAEGEAVGPVKVATGTEIRPVGKPVRLR